MTAAKEKRWGEREGGRAGPPNATCICTNYSTQYGTCNKKNSYYNFNRYS